MLKCDAQAMDMNTPAASERDRAKLVDRGNRFLRVAVFFLFFALRLAGAKFGLDQYLHTSWTEEEGNALPSIQAMAQGADGYLWLGTSTGLIRFDGARFTEWTPVSGPPLPSSDIRCLRAASNGAVWIGTAGGLCHVEGGRIFLNQNFDRLPCKVASSIVEESPGRLWVLAPCPGNDVLALLTPDGSVRSFGARDGLPTQEIHAISLDSAKHLWIGTSQGICKWSPGTRAVCFQTSEVHPVSIIEDSGALFIADGLRKRVLRLAADRMQNLAPVGNDSSFFPGALIRDQDGDLWIGTAGQGILRLHNGVIERLTHRQGLSSDTISGIIQDREGDIWASTTRGVDRIRIPNIFRVSAPDGVSENLIECALASSDGSIWIGTPGSGLKRLRAGREYRYKASDGLPSGAVAALYEDAAQRVWVGTAAGLAVQSGENFREVLTTAGEHLDRVFNIAGNAGGLVYVLDSRRGLFQVRNHSAEKVIVVGGSPPNDAYRLLIARDGAIWLGRYSGGITVLGNEAVRHYGVADGLAKGAVRALYEDPNGEIWVGATGGLSRFRDSHWETWSADDGLPIGGVLEIAEDETGALWLSAPAGILRVARTSLTTRTKGLPYLLYGASEGLRMPRNGTMTSPRITRDLKGRLWLCTDDGIAIIDPRRIKTNPVPPSVAIEQITADGRAFNPSSRLDIMPPHEIRIVFTGISLMAPERVRFRYRMESLDRNWTDAGTHRTVTYVNLSPGRYRFHVIASNGDGVWNDQGAQVTLRIEPYFYQTAWFAGACLGGIALVTWSIHQIRLRRLVSQFQLIAAERARFSRALHDSLLQGFSGVVYQLEAAVRQFEAVPERSRERLERALNQADQSLQEARQLIVNMRIPALENSSLPAALQSTVAETVVDLGIDFRFDVKGRVRQGSYDLEANIFLIAREAVTNALNHAQAQRITVELGYDQNQLTLVVHDDGTGFDTDAALSKPGHWGLRSMFERARNIGAIFTVQSSPGNGTKLSVAVPWKG